MALHPRPKTRVGNNGFFETVDELTLIVEGASKWVRDYREFTT